MISSTRFRRAAAVAVLALAAAPAVPAAHAAPKRSCRLLTDARGDAKPLVPPPVMPDGALDLLSADVGLRRVVNDHGAKVWAVVGVIRVRNLSELQANPLLLASRYDDFVLYEFRYREAGNPRRTGFSVLLERPDPNGPLRAEFYRWTGDRHIGAGGMLDERNSQLVMHYVHYGITLGSRITDFSLTVVEAPRVNQHQYMYQDRFQFAPADSATSSRTYVVGAPSCVPQPR